MVKENKPVKKTPVASDKTPKGKNTKKAFKPKPKTFSGKPAKPKAIIVPKSANPLKLAYSNMSRNVANPELMKQRISEFLAVVETDLLANMGKLLGSKGLQMAIKYGSAEHKKRVLVQVMTLDIEKVIKMKYAYFFLKKLLKQSRNDKVKKMFLDFFRNNFHKLFKSKLSFKFLELLLTNVFPADKLAIINKELTMATYDEFHFREFIGELILKPRLLELEISQVYLYKYFSKIPKIDKSKLLAAFLEKLDYIMKNESWVAIVLLGEMFKDAEFKMKKEVMKKCLKDKFWEYYTQNKYFIIFLVQFLRLINDEKVINITLSRRIIQNFSQFFKSVSSAKLLFLIFSKTPANSFSRDRASFPADVRALFLDKIETDDTFQKNCQLIMNNLQVDPTIIPLISLQHMQPKINENSQYSLLYGFILENFIQSPKASDMFENLFSDLNTLLSNEAQWTNQDSIIFSACGHRFIKRVIQNLGNAHTQVTQQLSAHVSTFTQHFKNHLAAAVQSKAVFILIALTENEEVGEDIKRFIKQNMAVFDAAGDSSGVKILKQIVTEN